MSHLILPTKIIDKSKNHITRTFFKAQEINRIHIKQSDNTIIHGLLTLTLVPGGANIPDKAVGFGFVNRSNRQISEPPKGGC